MRRLKWESAVDSLSGGQLQPKLRAECPQRDEPGGIRLPPRSKGCADVPGAAASKGLLQAAPAKNGDGAGE